MVVLGLEMINFLVNQIEKALINSKKNIKWKISHLDVRFISNIYFVYITANWCGDCFSFAATCSGIGESTLRSMFDLE